MKTKFLFILILTIGLIQAVFSQEIKVSAETPRGYQIGPGDVVSIKVLGEPDFNIEAATVDEDGKVQIYEAGITAKCRTEKELRDDVSKYLSKYLRNPQVSVYVTKRNSRPPVSIYGEVREQQQVDLTRKAHLLQLIAFAGGVTEKSGGMIQVFRTQPPLCADSNIQKEWNSSSNNGLDVPSRLYSLSSLRQGREEANPEIFPGDIIVVQKAASVYVTGEVIRPGEVGIPEGGLPLMQAVAMTGGITREAKTKTIKVYRRKEGSTQPETIIADYEKIKKGEQGDIMLEPFDIVEVDKSKKNIGDYLLEFVTGVPNRIPIRPF